MTLIEEFEELCKYIREVTGGDLVCGLCEYDAGTVGEEPMECPGFNSNECFKLKESFKEKYPAYNGAEVTLCKDCRYYDAEADDLGKLCTRREGCVVTIPEGYCGWAVRAKMDEVSNG